MVRKHEPMVVALSLAKAGIPVHPCRDKAPLLKRPLDGATTDLEQIATWWGGEFPDAQVGYYPGMAGLVVIDVDEKGDVSGSANLAAAGLELPDTITYRTPSGGRHHIYRAPAGRALTGRNGHPVRGVDIRAGNANAIWYGAPLTDGGLS